MLELIPAVCDDQQLQEIEQLPAATGTISGVSASWLGEKARPVRAMLFDQSANANWSLGWHQDRVIAVKQRVETIGFENWMITDYGVSQLPAQLEWLGL
jgi:hypothetical protein